MDIVSITVGYVLYINSVDYTFINKYVNMDNMYFLKIQAKGKKN